MKSAFTTGLDQYPRDLTVHTSHSDKSEPFSLSALSSSSTPLSFYSILVSLSKPTMSIRFASPQGCFFATAARFSSPSHSPAKLGLASCSIVVRSNVRARRSSVLCFSLKSREMAEMVEDKESAGVVVASSSASERSAMELGHSRTFLDVRGQEDLLSGIKQEAESGNLPSNVAQGMEELYHNYRNAIFQSGIPNADEIVLSNMAVFLDRVLKDVEDPFVFSPHHMAVREPFDYYMFGQNYIRPLVDFRSSYVGNISIFYEMDEKLQQGHNIVLISNHQTEADPAIIALLLEASLPHIAENMTYVAGDRVLTDPLCKPFSMGRNLVCVYSKNHLYDVPELAEMKKRANTRSLKEMALLLRGGSQIIWIAPSGGRDRPDPITKEWYPAPFDASSVDNMRRLVEHAGIPGHIYPLAILCHDIMPPPPQVEKEIGERRVVSYRGAGLSVAPEICFHEIDTACGVPEESKMQYSQALYNSIVEQYNVLKCAIHGKKGLEASLSGISLSQPWN
ncbi:Glycerol-3-phosphate 1-O-acyltransferase [Bertholletia excelsa]